MVQNFLLFLGCLILGLGFLFPSDMTLWKGFIGEYLIFVGCFFILTTVLFYKNIIFPKILIPFLAIVIVPLIQYLFGHIYLWTTSILSFFYIFAFILVIALSYNLEILEKEKLIHYFSVALLISGLVSTFMAITQWLDIYIPYFPTLSVSGSRPYANFGQPNHLSTFLCMASIATWYLYEKDKLKFYYALPISIFLIWGIILAQSRTAWLVSLSILGCYLYFKKKTFFKLKTSSLCLLILFYFILVFNLKEINNFLNYYLNLDVMQLNDGIKRATNGHERLNIWKQSWDLILEQPWFGYGWNQVGVSVIERIDHFYLNLWYSSSHNIILDLFLWVGLPLGILITIFCLYFLYILFKNSHTKESHLALLMALPILIHANLEYPLFYSYFLLPLALLLGIALTDINKLNSFKINIYIIFSTIFCYGLVLTFTWNEYVRSLADQSKAKIIALERMAKKDNEEFKIENNYYLLTSLKMHAEWVALNAYDKYTLDDLQRFENFVKVNPSSYNLLKLAQIYFYNADLENANKYLKIFNKLFDGNFTLVDLAKVRN